MKELKSELMNRRQVVAERHTIATRHRRLSLRTLAFSLQPLAFLLAFCLQPLAFAQTGATVTWAGGNTYNSWLRATNWTPQIVPLNNAGTNFTVLVPDGTSLRYDATNAGAIDALSFGAGSVLYLTNGQPLQVNGVALLKGAIVAIKPGSAFRAPANTMVLSANPRFLVSDGAQIALGASSYSWDAYSANVALFSAIGSGSLVDLKGVTTMQIGASGSYTYAITARSNGIIDLSGLGNLSGPSANGVLELNVDTGGLIKLDSARQVTGITRFNVGAPGFEFPHVNLIANTSINVSNGAVCYAGELNSLANSTLNVSTGAIFQAPLLTLMDTVPLNLVGNGAFIATNLTTYRNSDIPIYPGRDFEPGLLTNIYGSRISVSGGTNFRVAAAGYQLPGSGYYDSSGNYLYPPKNLFTADGTGSLLDLSSLKSIQVYGAARGYDSGWRNDWTYFITAANQGVIDLSGLEIVYGADPNSYICDPYYGNCGYYGQDDWLSLKVQSGGNILLPSLKQVTRRTRFDISVSQFQMPSLQMVDNTVFNLTDGCRLDLASLQWFDTSSISFGFNSSFNAPQLLNFVNSDLNLAPGKIINTPAFTNIYGSRFSVSSGVSWTNCAATNYEGIANWNASPTLFSADGMGSLLDVSSLKSLKVYGGSSGSYTYSISANNSGVVNLSGLETMTGADPINYGRDDWLSLSVQNGGNIRLQNLREITGRTSFSLGDGTRLDLTNLTAVADGVVISPNLNSVFNAPRLTQLINCDLTVAAGTFIAPPLTNIYLSRLSVGAGHTLHVAAMSYQLPGSGYYDSSGNYLYPPKNLFTADGTGSLLDLSSLKSIQVYGAARGYDSGWRNDWTYFITAANQGVIDLSGLEIVYGADPNSYICDPYYGNCGYYGQDDWLSFNATMGGVFRLGNISVNRRASFSASGPNSALEFASLYLRSPATLSLGAGSQLRMRGDFIFENTDTNSILTEFVRFQMDGASPQSLEVGGRDLGPLTTSFRRNFGYSQLIVGSTTNGSIVKLVDTINNGGRGALGEPEALYLYGLEGQGLRLLSGSRLMLGGLNCYANVNGQMVNLRTLIPSGTNSVAFDGGFIGNYGGPIITNMAPSVTVTPPVGSVDVSFNMALQGSSFTTDDVSVTGMGGPVAVTGVTLVSNTTWRLSFVPQTADGVYTVRVGPNINELAGNFLGMDQNGNGISGEPADAFSGTFVIDGTPPVLLGAYALQNGNRVGLTFDETVAPAFATNAANYFVNGNAVTNATIRTNGNQVVISVSPMVGDTFTLVVSNATDLLGNTANRTFTGTILPFEPRDIGNPGSDPRDTGSTVAFTETDFDSIGGGSSIWSTSDAFHLLFERRTGDFDVRAQIARLDRPGNYAEGGIMLRETLAVNSAKVQAIMQLSASAKSFYLGVRASTGGSVSYPAGVGSTDGWIRLRRQGSVFTGFRSTNGVDWVEYARLTNSLPVAGYLGLVTCSDDNTAGRAATVWYRNYSDLGPSIITQPQRQAVASGSDVVFAVTARGLPTLAYQWFHDGLAIPSRTNSLLALSAVTTNAAGDYYAVVTNNFGSVTSQVATLVVDGVGAGGFEADVSPTPYGNNVVTVSDWVKVGRFVAGLDTVASSSEFMRADCAPRTNELNGTLPLGNGRLTVADWTQAGRYAAGLDPLTPAGGSNAPAGFGFGALTVEAGLSYQHDEANLSGRSIWVANAKGVPGQVVSVPVSLEAQGDENALGFTLNFEPARLGYQTASLADGVTGVTLQINAQHAELGRLGFVLGRSAGQTFTAGSRTLLQVRFMVLGTPAAEAAIGFGDVPVFREVVNATADPLAADYVSGVVRIVQAGHLAARLQPLGGPLELTLTGQAGETYRVEVSNDLVLWSTLATQKLGTEPVVVLDGQAGLYRSRFYRAVLQ